MTDETPKERKLRVVETWEGKNYGKEFKEAWDREYKNNPRPPGGSDRVRQYVADMDAQIQRAREISGMTNAYHPYRDEEAVDLGAQLQEAHDRRIEERLYKLGLLVGIAWIALLLSGTAWFVFDIWLKFSAHFA